MMLESLYEINPIILGFLALGCVIALRILLSGGNSSIPGRHTFSPLGDAYEIRKHGIREVCKKYRETYGDIFQLRIFFTKRIVCCGLKNLSEMLVQHRHVIMQRPYRHLRDLVFARQRGVISSTGEVWKQNRHFTLQTLKDFGLGKRKLETKILEEIDCLLDVIDKTKGEPFDIVELMHRAVANIMTSIVFGERYEYDDKNFSMFLHEITKMAAFTTLFKYPWQQYLPGDPFGVKDHLKTLNYLRDFYVEKIDRHFKDYKEDVLDDFIYVYIKHMKDNSNLEKKQYFNEEQLVTLVHDLYSAGTETTALAILWGLIFLMRNDNIQTTVHEELDSCIPSSRYPTTSDKTNIPYFYATLQEILRRAVIAPFAGRVLTQEVKFKGQTFPKSSTILFDMDSIQMGSDQWDEPEKFNPSRFLGKKGEDNLSKMLPFSTGPRSCLGEAVARTEHFLFLAALLQRYKFVPPIGEDPPGLGGIYGITHQPNPFRVRAIRRR